MSLKTGMAKATTVILRIVYAPMKLRPLRKKVTIISRQSNKPSLDVAGLAGYLSSSHEDVQVTVLCRNLERSNKLIYALHLLRQMWHISNSAAVVLDGYCIPASVLDHRRATKFIQMWHALAAVKKFGYQTLDRPGGRSSEIARIMRMHKNYDVVVCPGERTGHFFCQAFNTDESKLAYYGLPRIDHILRGDAKAEEIRRTYSLPEVKEILLYVPTFRKGEPVPLEELARAIPGDRFCLVVRLHPLYGEYTGGGSAGDGAPEGDGPDGAREDETPLRIIVDREYTSYDWLHVADRVITDYSALGVEASLLDKPLYFYVYDIDAYENNVGLNLDPRKELPGASAETAEKLAGLLTEDYDLDALRQFRQRYITVDTDNCTEKLGEYIYGIAEKIH